MNRDELTFERFFNVGIDRITGECDVEGTDVYEDGHYVGSIKWVLPTEIEGMEDDELNELLLENGILI